VTAVTYVNRGIRQIASLSPDVTATEAKATLSNGMLEIVPPKGTDTQPRRIEVKAR